MLPGQRIQHCNNVNCWCQHVDLHYIPERKDKDSSAGARESGNDAFAAGEWKEAIRWYTVSIKAKPNDHRPWSNRAQTNLQLERWEDAEFDASTAAQITLIEGEAPDKSYYRRALARFKLGRLEAAKRDLNRVLKSNPTQQQAVRKLAEIEEAIRLRPAVSSPATEGTSTTYVLDHTSYPHVLKCIILHAAPQVLLALRATCRTLRDLIASPATHVEISADSNVYNHEDMSQIFKFTKIFKTTITQSTPPGSTHTSYEGWQDPATSILARQERTMFELCCLNARVVDLRGHVPQALHRLFPNHEVVRIRTDKNGDYPHQQDLSLMTSGSKKVVIFPGIARPETDGGGAEVRIDLPKTVNRIVYLLDVFTPNASTPEFLPVEVLPSPEQFSRLGFGRHTFDTVLNMDPSAPIHRQRDVVLICPTVASTPEVKRHIDLATLLLWKNIVGITITGLGLGSERIKIVNLEGAVPFFIHAARYNPGILPRFPGRVSRPEPFKDNHFGPQERMFVLQAFQRFIKDKVFEIYPTLAERMNSLLHTRPYAPLTLESLNKIDFLTEEEYRGALKAGEWEEETVEVMPGFM